MADQKKSARRRASERKDFSGHAVWKEGENQNLIGKIKYMDETEYTDGGLSNSALKLDGDLRTCMETIWTEQKKPQKLPPDIDFLLIKLAALNSLSRSNKRKMLGLLGKDPKEIRVLIDDKPLKQTSVSLAAVLIIYVSLHKEPEKYDTGETSIGNNTAGAVPTTEVSPTDLFAELFGCAGADTIKELSPYLLPPLMTPERLPGFIHCAVRQ